MKTIIHNPLATTSTFQQVHSGCGYYAVTLYQMLKELMDVELTKKAIRNITGSNTRNFVRAAEQLSAAGYITYTETSHSFIVKVLK